MNPEALIKMLSLVNGYLAAGDAAFELGKGIVQSLRKSGVSTADAKAEIDIFRARLEAASAKNSAWLDAHVTDNQQ